MPIALPSKLSLKNSFGSRISSGLPSLYFVFRGDAGADDLLRRDAINTLTVDAHKVLPAAGDDERLEPVSAQIVEDLDHRLIDQFGVEPFEPRMLRRRQPLPGDRHEFRLAHAGVGNEDDLRPVPLGEMPQR